MFNKNEKNIIFIIRYAPLLLILGLSVLITLLIKQSNYIHFEEEVKRTTNFYTNFHNEEIKDEVYRVYEYIETQNRDSIKNLKLQIKKRVYEAHSIATKIYEDNKHNKSKQDILKLIKSALGSIIYNEGRGYFFIDNVDGVKLLQPLNKELENKDLSEFADAKGYKFAKNIIQTTKHFSSILGV